MTIPLPPVSLGPCLRCRHWLVSELAEYVMTPQGPFPLAKIPQDQRLTVAKMSKHKGAPCTFLPTWTIQPADSWCWQWVKVQGQDDEPGVCGVSGARLDP